MDNGIFQSDLAAVIQPRVLLKPESWLSKIEFINHLVLFNNVLITVLSEKEGGKTSFATLLQNDLDSQIKLLAITISVPCSREKIIHDIATQFHLKYDEHTDVSSLVAQINERKAHVLLLIDDAQHLPETFIKEVMLAIKNQENFNFFHLCLISDYSIVAALNGFSASFFNDLVHTIELGALNESEARTYVLQRAVASHLITKPLTDAQLKQFYQLTKGNVAKINNGLESFIFNCSAKKPDTVMDMIKKVSIPVGTALLSGAICLFIAKGYYQEPASDVVAAVTQPQNPPKLPDTLVSQIASWQDSSTRELVDHTLAEKQNLDLLGKAASPEVIAIADKAVMHAKTNIRVATKPSHQNKQPQLAKAVATSMEKLYTIQLVASPDKVDMERYRKNNKLLDDSAKLNYYTENKVVWYVLTIGEYSTMTDAQKTISQLPPTLKKLNPWVRPIATLG
jgi:hypothetical protein